ncbi:MAG: FAD-binding oxidoreductase [Rhodobacteraceae bacterium]|nr:FAD-binding oxidoreductase [Paracoccaceae bacterium]
MNPLFRNDAAGEYPPSWYTATAETAPERPALAGDHRFDACVIGAGFTGLSAALFLAEKGFSVAVLEAHRAGFGASGRNGGQVGSGYNKDQIWLEKQLGPIKARALWDMAEAAKDQVRTLSAAHAPDARFLPGVAHGEYSARDTTEHHDYIAHLHDTYGYDQVDCLDAAAFADLVRSPRYKGGIVDRGAGHIHPLRYALGLARAAEAAGAQIFERSAATRIETGTQPVIHTDQGRITCDHLIVAGNGYLPDLDSAISSHVMPINSFIAATEPLGHNAQKVLTEDIAVADSKFVVNYYRMSEDNRFLFGGRESYTLGFPTDITTKLRERMLSLFPQLSDASIDYVWGGTLGITMTRLPYLARIGPSTLTASGFSGHGVALSGFAGRIMAEAAAGQAERFDLMSELPTPAFPGGKHLRAPILTLAMTWYSLRDRLGV